MKETAWNVIENVAGGGGGADAIIQTLAEEGFVIVPKEPTEQMVSNGVAQSGDHPDVAVIYRAMIAAVSKDK